MSLLSQTLQAEACLAPVASVQSVQGKVEWLNKDATNWSLVKLNDLFCPGDRIRVGHNSRTSILLHGDTLIRLAERSNILLSTPATDGSHWVNLLEGMAHFISRIQHRFQVNTPYVNAFIEGTEFTVAAGFDRASVTVLEGQVAAKNSYGEVTLKGGQMAVAYAHQAPQVEQAIDPLDAVKWTLYYPPLIDHQAMDRYHRDDPLETLAQLARKSDIAQDPALLVYRASLHLRVGGVDAARSDLEKALSITPDQADGLALLSIIATVQNQPLRALALAQRARETNPRGLAPLLALSYAQQAKFDLTAALDAARQATQAVPDSVLAWSQKARLHLMFRHLDDATQAAQRAVEIDPDNALPHTTLGFVHLAGFQIDKARQAFEKAILLDRHAAPLPRFGLGLVEIRKGRLEEGRRQLEIAANLDPGNTMIRSYLGKAYYEEKRNSLAATQFALAKQFDENDPTAWFYNAILQQSQNRPVNALTELRVAIDLNDNRAVYRSRFLLDQDEAARDASQARIYQDLGFEQPARHEAYTSLQLSPQNHSAHRFLADSYNGDAILDTARMSELLQSQLLQPLNSNPIQPQLAVSGLGILDGAGPSDTGYAEFTPLFTRNGLNLQLNGVAGSDDTGGDDLILSGLHDRIAFSLGQFHYETAGWRENNDLKQDIYNAFLQLALTPSSSIQLEYRRQDKESGDLDLTFEAEDVDPYERNRLTKRINRIGLHHELASNGHLIASAIGMEIMDIKERVNVPIFLTAEQTGSYPAEVDHTGRMSTDSTSRLLELQMIQPFYQHSVILGAGSLREDRALVAEEWNRFFYQTPDGIIEVPAEPPVEVDNIDPEFRNLYLYTQLDLPDQVNLTLGMSYENYESTSVDLERTSPKLGITWEPRKGLSLRAAYMESLVRPQFLDQTIEPTQVAGFNQLLFIGQGADIEQFGIGINAKLKHAISVAADYTRKDIQVPWNVLVGEDFFDVITHEVSHAYCHWTPTDRIGLRIAYEDDRFTGTLSPQVIKTKRLPLGINYYWPSGFSLKAEGIHVRQKVTRNGNEQDQDDFWNVDLVAAYRFPKRHGKVEFAVKNLLDESFNYYDAGYHIDEMASPQYWPERQVFVRVSFNL